METSAAGVEMRGDGPRCCGPAQSSAYQTWATVIQQYVQRIMGNAQDAQDITQDVFEKAMRNWERFSGTDLGRKAWLYRIARHACIDQLRHRRILREVSLSALPWRRYDTNEAIDWARTEGCETWEEAEGGTAWQATYQTERREELPEPAALDREQVEEMQRLLHRLNPMYRRSLVLREYQHLSYDEIGEVLQLTRPAVKSLLCRARQRLRQLYVQAEGQGAAVGGVTAAIGAG